MSQMNTIYADHSATTKVRSEVVEAMVQVLREDFGNPSSIHNFGRKAKSYLNKAREDIASVINADKEQIVFTSGGTESDNLVILGILKSLSSFNKKHIITTQIEHSAIKEPLESLAKEGWDITWLNVDSEGFVDLKELEKTITSETLLVSIIHANNEIGTIQDLKEISSICRKNNVLFHTDAVQSFCKVPINIEELNIDFMSMSSHKIYGPKGVGALYVRDLKKLKPSLIGGGQENKLRPGTENLPGIVGFALAAKLLNSEMYSEAMRLRKLQLLLMEKLTKLKNIILTGVEINKLQKNLPTEKYLDRLPGHVSLCMKDIEGESLVLQMDLKGIAVSSASACKSSDLKDSSNLMPSHVLEAIGVSLEYIKGSLRITLGRESTEKDIDCIVSALESLLSKTKVTT